MQHYEQSYRYSSDSGTSQHSRRERNQSYRSGDDRSSNNNMNGGTGTTSTSIYAKPYLHRTSYTSEKSDGRNSNYNATGVSGTSTPGLNFAQPCTSENFEGRKSNSNANEVAGSSMNSVNAQPYLHRVSYASAKSDCTKTSKSTTTTTQTNRKSIEQQYTTSGINPTIALFGVGSKTSIYFLRQALDAGYHVRAMIIHQAVNNSDNLYPLDQQVHSLAKELRDEFSSQVSNGTLHWIRADYIYDTIAIQRTIRNTHYVVCMMQDSAPLSSYGVTPTDDGDTKSMKKRQHCHQPTMILPMDPKLCPDPTKPISSFLQILYPIMKNEATIKVFLYQVCTHVFKLLM